jgi:hypothetical protein
MAKGVICDDNGLAIFDKLHSKLNDESVMLLPPAPNNAPAGDYSAMTHPD